MLSDVHGLSQASHLNYTQNAALFLAQCAAIMTGTVCFEEKTAICNAKFGDLRDNGDRGSKYVVESAIFGIADPDLPIHYATFTGLQ